MPTDDAARRALAWIERGQPDSEIVFDEEAPKQTPEELAQFKSASLRRKS
jgi:hypothetical protein